MTEALSSSVKVITHPEAMNVLLDVAHAAPLEVFFKAACSIDEAAQRTGMKANTLYRRVQKWCDLGLLEVVAERPRRGRPVKLYRTTAERFFVPFASTSAPSYEALLQKVDSEFQAQFYRSLARAWADVAPHWGYTVSLGMDGTIHLRTYKTPTEPFDYEDPAAPVTVNVWNTELYLTLEEAAALQKQLFEFWRSRDKTPGTRPYLIQLRLAPALEPK